MSQQWIASRFSVQRARTLLTSVGKVQNPGVGIVRLLVVGLFLTVGGLLVLASPASAELPQTPDVSAQANGRVSVIVREGDRIYLGGSFTQFTNPDGTTVERNSLAAIDANTGQVVPGWNPNANGSVRAMAFSPDGTRLYVGGTFTSVGGLSRNRLAALEVSTGTVDKRWTAGTNAVVWAVTTGDDGSVYAGGNFTTVRGTSRNHIAKVDGATGAVNPNWTPSADQISTRYGSVRAMEFSENGARIYIGGYFQSVSGQQTGNLAALDPVTGAVDAAFRPNDGNGIQCLAVDGGRVFVGTGDPLEGIEAFDATTGSLAWRLGYGAHTPSEGDVQAITVSEGTVYAGGHFDKMAEYTRNRLVAVDAATGQVDSQWSPFVSGGDLGVWALEAYGPHLYVGGDFLKIASRQQQKFAQFTDGPELPDKGLTGEYFDNKDLTNPKVTRTDATVNYDWNNFAPNGIGPDTWSARWSGKVKPAYSETYTFYTTSDDGVRLWVDGKLIIDKWTDQAPTENSGQVTLTARQLHDVRMEYYENGGGAVAKLWWSSARQTKQVVPQSRLYPAVASP